jgi:hypothetical protein
MSPASGLISSCRLPTFRRSRTCISGLLGMHEARARRGHCAAPAAGKGVVDC